MKRAPVQVLDRIVDILEYLADAGGEVALVDIANSVNLERTTAFRLLASLCERDLVAKNIETRRYRLGPKLFELGAATARQWDVCTVARPLLEQLRDACGETVGMYVRAGNHRVCVERLEGRGEVRRNLVLGRVQPLYPGAPGKVFLAYMPRRESLALLADLLPAYWRDGTKRELADVLTELDEVVAVGYASAVEELVPNAATLACPVFDHAGNVCAAITIATIIPSWSADRREELAQLLKRAAAKISATSRRPEPAGASVQTNLESGTAMF